MTRGGKYSNKTPRMRFFHKYTGLIVLSIILVVIATAWLYSTSTQVFFEGWNCEQINAMDHMTLFDEEHTRYHEIHAECSQADFMP